MRTERRTARIKSMYSTKGLQPLNGEMMTFDFPIKRPIYYWVGLDNGDEIEVSRSRYYQCRVGETLSYDYDVWETSDTLVVAVVILILVLVACIIAV